MSSVPWRTDHVDEVLVRLPNLKLLILKPSPIYGNLGLDLHQGFHTARELGAAVYVLAPRGVTNPAVCDLQPDGVRTLRRSSSRDRVMSLIFGLVRMPSNARTLVMRALRKAARVAGVRVPQGAPGWHGRRSYFGSDFRREASAHPLPVSLPPDLETDARRQAAAAGIDLDRPVVTLHMREAGSKPDRRPREAARNVEVESCFPAIDLLVERGYTVVRLGDPSMSRVQRPGVVDLAHAPARTGLLEVWCVLHSTFFLCCDSGPYHVALLTETPTLQINAIDQIGCFPVPEGSLCMLKHVDDLDAGRRLGLAETAAPDNYLAIRDAIESYDHHQRYRFVDNSAGEIQSAVVEMLEGLASLPPESEAQREYRQLLTRTTGELRTSQAKPGYWLRRFGAGEPFLGKGRLVAGFVAAHLHHQTLEAGKARHG